jgi:hypothetical protein
MRQCGNFGAEVPEIGGGGLIFSLCSLARAMTVLAGGQRYQASPG